MNEDTKAELRCDYSASDKDSASFYHTQMERDWHVLINSLLLECVTVMDSFLESTFILKPNTA